MHVEEELYDETYNFSKMGSKNGGHAHHDRCRGAAGNGKYTGADAFRIERKKPYSEDYSTVADDAEAEMKKNARPELKNPLKSIEKYQKVVICYPIWWHTAPMVVGTFLEAYDWTGKTIYPVSQSASMDRTQYKQSVTFIKDCAKGAKVDDGLFSESSSKIRNYVRKKIQ